MVGHLELHVFFWCGVKCLELHLNVYLIHLAPKTHINIIRIISIQINAHEESQGTAYRYSPSVFQGVP